jgi:hypothetical protein
MQQKQDQPEEVPPLEEEDKKQGIDGPTKNKSQNYQKAATVQKKANKIRE